MGEINTTLSEVGTGVGGLFDGIAIPLMTLVILLGVATGVGAILYGIAKRISE
jgi:hypothetical protein